MNRIAQIYGYAVCLVAVIVAVANIGEFTNSLLAVRDPLNADFRYGVHDNTPVTSYEAYRVAREQGLESRGPQPDTMTPAELPPDSVLRRHYAVLRATRESSVRAAAQRQLVQSGVLLGVAVLLFATHWGWVRRRERTDV